MRSYFTHEQIFFLSISVLCLTIIYPYIISFSMGVALAYLFEPLLEKVIFTFKLKKKIWKWIVSILIVTLTVVSVIGPILTVITTGIHELLAVLSFMELELKDPEFITNISKNASVLLKKFSLQYSPEELVTKGTEFVKDSASMVASFAGTAITSTPGFVLNTLVFILTWCFFLVQGKSYRYIILPKMIPWETEREIISRTVSSVLKALIVANVLVSCIQAVLITTCLALFGIPRFALLGIVAFFMSFIPVIGTAPIMIGAAAWSFFGEGHLGYAIGILICAVFISLTDNVLRPLFMKGGMELNFFWVFLAIVGGMSQFGVSGAVLGPVFFALFVAAYNALQSSNQKKYLGEDVPNP